MSRKRYGALLLGVAFATFICGCSQNGSLNVKNGCATEFTGTVGNQYVELAPGQSYPLDVYIGKSAGFIGPSEYDITVAGSAWTKKPFTVSVAVKSDETTSYTISDDAGVILFWNAYNVQVNRVRVRKCGDASFGENLITTGRVFSPGDRLVIQLDPGCWDLLVNYRRDEVRDTAYAIDVTVGAIDTIGWYPGYPVPPTR